jgi:hypothetical protein
MELAGELLLDGGEVDPCAFAANQTVAEVEYVQEPRPHRPAAPLEPERRAFRRCVQDRLVDDVVVAVPASHEFEALDSSVQEGQLASTNQSVPFTMVENSVGARPLWPPKQSCHRGRRGDR